MIDQPKIQTVKRGKYLLLDDYIYKYDKNTTILIKNGFKYDGSSVPWFVWTVTGILPIGTAMDAAALVHDAMYRFKGKLPKMFVIPYREFTRFEADRLFLKMCEEGGESVFRRNFAYRIIRLAFWKNWK